MRLADFDLFHRQGALPEAFHINGRILFRSVILLLLLIVSVAVQADGASVARGGRLFDNWIMEGKERVPEAPNPNFRIIHPDMHDVENSWRCVSCHGWNFEGKKDQGTKPLETGRKLDAVLLADTLNNAAHQYTDRLSKRDINDLAAFISSGRIDLSSFIRDGKIREPGDPEREAKLYATVCLNCHGSNGQKSRGILPLGTFARAFPQETLHKIMNGHPGEQMPPMRILEISRLVDLLAYIQILPDINLQASITRGGRLYDNWQKESGTSAQQTRHVSYPLDAEYADRPEANWRCKECHGWDYKGQDGVYGQGDHRTGVTGIRQSANASTSSIVKLLMSPSHGYHSTAWSNGPLLLQDLLDLANFVAYGQFDTDQYIDVKTRRAKAEAAQYKDTFDIFCATCHGTDGRKLATGYDLGDVARRNPWEALHKIRNGHPGESMPALQSVLDMKVLTGLLAYAQSLP